MIAQQATAAKRSHLRRSAGGRGVGRINRCLNRINSARAVTAVPTVGRAEDVTMNSFRFNLLGLLGLITFVAFFLGATALTGRLVGIGELLAFQIILGTVIDKTAILAVWLVGAVVLVRRWNLHPLASRYALIAMCGLFALFICDLFFQIWFQGMVSSGGVSPNTPWKLLVAKMVGSSLLSAVCWVLLLMAVVAPRANRERPAHVRQQATAAKQVTA